jgi:hypothetical protein
MNKSRLLGAVCTCVISFVTLSANAAPVIYTDELFPPSGGEAAYIGALTAGGYGTLQEGFEDNGVWAGFRNPLSTQQVNSQDILWASNLAANNITTDSTGRAGSYGFFSSPHGDQTAETNPAICDVPDPIPEQCFLHDGFVGTNNGAGTLYGVGAWINGMSGAKVALFLDSVEVDLGNAGSINGWTFLGVTDTAGFNSFEFREINGTGEQILTIRADDVTLGVSAVPVPPAAWLFGSGLIALIGMLRRKSD